MFATVGRLSRRVEITQCRREPGPRRPDRRADRHASQRVPAHQPRTCKPQVTHLYHSSDRAALLPGPRWRNQLVGTLCTAAGT